MTLRIKPGHEEANMGDISVEEFCAICDLLQAQANAGDATAQQQCGVIDYRGVPEAGIKINHAAAAFWFEKAARRGWRPRSAIWAYCMCWATAFRKDDRQAALWISKAADAGLAPAQNHYGNFLQDGRGVSENPTLAVQYFQKAADQGEIDAMVNLGGACLVGRGCAKDEAKARSLLTAAASKGDKDAAQLLSRMDKPAQQPTAAERVERRRKVPSAEVQALLAKAEAGDADAQHKLSRMYYDKESGGVELTEAQAPHWLRRAAEAGHMSRSTILAPSITAASTTSNRTMPRRVRWTRAAEAGLTAAQFHRVRSQRRGIGVPQDERLAADVDENARRTRAPRKRGKVRLRQMLQCGSGGVEKTDLLAVVYFAARRATRVEIAIDV